MKKYYKTAVLAAAALVFAFTGCKKDETDSETQTAADNAQAESIFNDAVNIVDDGARKEKGINKLSPDNYYGLYACVTLKVDSDTVGAKNMLWDWGTTNCQGADGRFRRGKIYCEFSGPYSLSGTKTTIQFQEYYLNDNLVTGTITIRNDNANSVRTITIQNGSITNPANQKITFSGTHTFKWIQGDNTPLIRTDDIYEVSGNSNGTSINGNTFSTNITVPLVFDLNCKYITKGKIDITPGSKPTRTLDFGSGLCDDKATVTIQGNTFNITLH
jgi:hypothetical protein